jgi:anti-sigma B factor antagonist
MIFGVDVSTSDARATLTVHGDLDLGTSHRLRRVLVELDEAGATDVVVDLGDVDLLDSTGLGVLIGGLRRARQAGGELRLARLSPRHRELLSVTGLDRVFPLTVGSGGPPPSPT